MVNTMRYLHTMFRIYNLEAALDFFVTQLGLVETRRRDSEKGRYTLVFLSTGAGESELELTYNWDESEPYSGGLNFGHVAYEVDNIYALCQRLHEQGVTICRPPRDGRMAFIRSPDQISVELLQKGDALPPCEPWASMSNNGQW